MPQFNDRDRAEKENIPILEDRDKSSRFKSTYENIEAPTVQIKNHFTLCKTSEVVEYWHNLMPSSSVRHC